MALLQNQYPRDGNPTVEGVGPAIFSFRDIFIDQFNSNTSEKDNGQDTIPLKLVCLPRLEGGNVIVEIGEDEYYKGVNDLQFSMVGRLILKKGETPPTTIELQTKLLLFQKIESFKVIPLEK